MVYVETKKLTCNAFERRVKRVIMYHLKISITWSAESLKPFCLNSCLISTTTAKSKGGLGIMLFSVLTKFGITGKLWLKLLSKFAFWLWQSGWCGKVSGFPWDRLKSITLIPLLFICCKKPCFLGGFEAFFRTCKR